MQAPPTPSTSGSNGGEDADGAEDAPNGAPGGEDWARRCCAGLPLPLPYIICHKSLTAGVEQCMAHHSCSMSHVASNRVHES